MRDKVQLLAGTNNGRPIKLNMDLSSRVPEAEQASRDDWDWVAFIGYPREIRHLRVKERGPSHISNAGHPKRDSSDARALRKIKRHDQRVKFRESSAH